MLHISVPSLDTKTDDLDCACILVTGDGPEVARRIAFTDFIIKSMLCFEGTEHGNNYTSQHNGMNFTTKKIYMY